MPRDRFQLSTCPVVHDSNCTLIQDSHSETRLPFLRSSCLEVSFFCFFSTKPRSATVQYYRPAFLNNPSIPVGSLFLSCSRFSWLALVLVPYPGLTHIAGVPIIVGCLYLSPLNSKSAESLPPTGKVPASKLLLPCKPQLSEFPCRLRCYVSPCLKSLY